MPFEMNEEGTRQIGIQTNGLLKLLVVGTNYRLKAFTTLIDALLEPPVWHKIWLLLTPEQVQMLASMGAVQGAGDEPDVAGALAACKKLYADAGETVPEWVNGLDAKAAGKSPAYMKFKAGVTFAFLNLQMIAFMTGNKSFQEYVAFAQRAAFESFDELWLIDHPEDK